MNFTTIAFDQLTVRQLHQIYKLRVAVFVVEQHCPYQEVDDTDLTAWNLLGQDQQGHLIAYARLMQETNHQARIGRVLTNPDFRGQGAGKQLVQRALEQINALWPETSQVNIQAQHYLDRFYRRFGFEPVSAVYMEDGIPHQDMVLKLR